MSYGVTFWTEGGGMAGMGHVSRCLTVARAARALGLDVDFIVNDHGPVHVLLDDAGFPYQAGIFSGDSERCIDLTRDVVVLDTRAALRHLVIGLKRRGKKVVALDNLTAEGEEDATVIPSAFFVPDKQNRKVFGGAGYLIIGENFINSGAVRADVYSGGPLKVLVTFGGSDPNHITDNVVEALLGLGKYERVQTTVVLGPSSKPSDKLKAFIDGSDERMNFLCGVKDMAPVMADADLAITAMGISVYELAFMGVPSVLIGNYRRDLKEIEALERMGVTRGLGYFEDVTGDDIRDAVRGFSTDRESLRQISEKARRLTDGRGAARIAGIILDLAEGRAPSGGPGKNKKKGGVQHA